MQTTMFQPVGGMGKVGEAFARELGPLIRYNAKVIDIHQDERGVQRHLRGHRRAARRQTVARRLVRVHHSAVDPGPDSDERRRSR